MSYGRQEATQNLTKIKLQDSFKEPKGQMFKSPECERQETIGKIMTFF